MFFHAFAVTMFVLSITTFIIFAVRDRHIVHDEESPASRRDSHNAATRLLCCGAVISLLEAFSGWMSCEALADMRIGIFGNTVSDTISILVTTTLVSVAATIATRRLHTDMMSRTGLTTNTTTSATTGDTR